MIVLSKPLKHILPDAFTVATTTSTTAVTSSNAGKKKKKPSSSSSEMKKSTGRSSPSPLWFAARSDSKPGFPSSSNSNNVSVVTAECWTLISTPAFAVNEIQQTAMRDPITGEFRPQENKYLNSKINGGPAHTLKDAFYNIVRCHHNDDDEIELKLEEDPIYIQGQRWGSGLPIDPRRVDTNNKTPGNENVREICGTKYVANFNGSIVYNSNSTNKSNNGDTDKNTNTNTNTNDLVNDDDDTQEAEAEAEEVANKNFVADDDLGLYYAGDFCSMLNPGFEAAALSGYDVAQHIITNFDFI